MNYNETICAIATPPGGAIGIIRVSGKDAVTIADKLFTPVAPMPEKQLNNRLPYSLVFGVIKDKSGDIIDQVMASVYRAPHSYTGEDGVEFSCHGSPYVMQRINELLVESGCRTARPGEFTQRAFLNGKLDLVQAEAVADLIASTSAASHRMAVSQMRGDFSKALSRLRERLLRLATLIELELDFSDQEDVEFASRAELRLTAEEIKDKLEALIGSFSLGNALKRGIPVVITGLTNAGKSTLLNTLVNDEKALVSPIHGTTRDAIEDVINFEGYTFRFIDTAGIRNTVDEIEQMGIKQSFNKINNARIVVWVVDATVAEEQIEELNERILTLCTNKTLIVALNKVDLLCTPASNSFASLPKETIVVPISAKHSTGIDGLRRLLVETVQKNEVSQTDVIVTNARHYEALGLALKDIRGVIESLEENRSNDLVSEELRACLFHLAEIVGGEITSDEILGTIFKNFCIGK